MSAMQIEYWPLEQLTPYARNSRVHSPTQIEQIAALIQQFGWTNPVIADADGIVAGHGRVLAAQHLYEQTVPIRTLTGHTLPPGTVPVIDCTGWSPAQRRAYVIADNRAAELSSWDKTLLAEELGCLEIPELQPLFIDYDLPAPIQTADDVRRLEEQAPPEQSVSDTEYEQTMRDRNTRGQLPIIPRYLETHHAFIIVCDNAVDEAYIRQRLGLEEPAASYKGGKIRVPDIVSVQKLRELLS